LLKLQAEFIGEKERITRIAVTATLPRRPEPFSPNIAIPLNVANSEVTKEKEGIDDAVRFLL
jgi:hypothetical protein